MQIKTAMSYHYRSIRITTIKAELTLSAGKDVGEALSIIHCFENV